MEILKVEKYNDILYIGTVNGKDYKKIGIRPIQLSNEFYLKKQIDVTVIDQFVEIGKKVYNIKVALDSNNNILLQDIRVY